MAAAFTIVYVFAVGTPTGQRFDAATLGAFPVLNSSTLLPFYGVRDGILVGAGALVVVVALEALRRRRPGVVVIAGGMVCAVAVLTAILHQLPRPDAGGYGYPENTFPSGHVAVTLAAAIAVLWMAPPRIAGWLAAVVAWVAVSVVAVSSLLSFAHRGSDLVGGALVTGTVVALVHAVGFQGPPGLRRASVLGFVLIAVALVVALAGVCLDDLVVPFMAIAAIVGSIGIIGAVLAREGSPSHTAHDH